MALERGAPLIGITCEAIARNRDFSDYQLVCDHRYALAVRNAGGHPVLLPVAHRRRVLRTYLEGIDGLVIVGGDDVDPRLYGEAPKRATRVIYPRRTHFETWLYRQGRRRRLPILGICYGMQLINVLEGGTLYQQLPRRRSRRGVGHSGKRRGRHSVRFLPRTRLARIFGLRHGRVATEHHQAVRDLAQGFVPAAVALDGIIEAIESSSAPEVLAVQWHPERNPEGRMTQRLFRAFVRTCRAYRARR